MLRSSPWRPITLARGRRLPIYDSSWSILNRLRGEGPARRFPRHSRALVGKIAPCVSARYGRARTRRYPPQTGLPAFPPRADSCPPQAGARWLRSLRRNSSPWCGGVGASRLRLSVRSSMSAEPSPLRVL